MDSKLSALVTICTPVVLVMVQLIKNLNINSKFLPAISLFIGGITGGVVSYALYGVTDVTNGLVYGVLAGATATAGYASVKNTVQGFSDLNTQATDVTPPEAP